MIFNTDFGHTDIQVYYKSSMEVKRRSRTWREQKTFLLVRILMNYLTPHRPTLVYLVLLWFVNRVDLKVCIKNDERLSTNRESHFTNRIISFINVLFATNGKKTDLQFYIYL